MQLTTSRQKTRERYHEIAARWVIPHIGAHKLAKLQREHLKTWHSTLLSTGLAPRSVLHAHRLVSRILSEAVAGNIVASNVAAKVKPPAVPDAEIEILDADQVAIVLEALRGHSLYPIAALAISTGMRRGELLALHWSDINLDAATLRCERSVEETRAGLRLKQPKTRAGRRNIALAPDTVAMLRTHRAEQMRLRLALGQGGSPKLVFGTLEDELRSPDNLSRDWCRTVRAKRLPLVSFHSLRHTCASLMIAAGTDILTISRRLGHRKASVTLDTYGHLVKGKDAEAAKAIEGLLK